MLIQISLMNARQLGRLASRGRKNGVRGKWGELVLADGLFIVIRMWGRDLRTGVVPVVVVVTVCMIAAEALLKGLFLNEAELLFVGVSEGTVHSDAQFSSKINGRPELRFMRRTQSKWKAQLC